jgi:hypothetical protein
MWQIFLIFDQILLEAKDFSTSTVKCIANCYPASNNQISHSTFNIKVPNVHFNTQNPKSKPLTSNIQCSTSNITTYNFLNTPKSKTFNTQKVKFEVNLFSASLGNRLTNIQCSTCNITTFYSYKC